MASKYDTYWLSIMKEIQNGIVEAVKKGMSINLDIHDITEYGMRNGWYGTVDVSPEGIKGGEMAHAMSLGKMVMKQNFFKNMNDIWIRFKISNSLNLEIDVVSEPITPVESEKKETMVTSRKSESIDKIITTPQTLMETIYSLLGTLQVYDCSYKSSNLPDNGIYFFYEEGEYCKINSKVMERIVRIGTHKSDNRFRDRIRNHYRGNKNSSVFRTHIGSAIITKNRLKNIDINEWMKHMTPTNNDIERIIDDTFKKNFKFRCISVQTKNERLNLEEKLIATLSHYNFTPSDNWLGHFAERKEIRSSGLWNVQHINSQNRVTEQDLAFLKEKINTARRSDLYTTTANNTHQLDTNNGKVMCFIPCCKGKFASGNIIKPEHSLSNQDLPNTFDMLLGGRFMMKECIEDDTQKASAIHLYNGKLYRPLHPYKDEIIKLIQSNKLRVIIISAGYGIIDALEPIQKYEAILQGRIASGWKRNGLANIIAKCIIHERPSHVYGFFSGESNWSNSGSQYRYFFTEGLKIALMNGFKTELSGCFYKIEGGGFPSFKELTSLGNTLVDLLKIGFNEAYITNVQEKGRCEGDVKIGFDKITL